MRIGAWIGRTDCARTYAGPAVTFGGTRAYVEARTAVEGIRQEVDASVETKRSTIDATGADAVDADLAHLTNESQCATVVRVIVDVDARGPSRR